MNIDLKRTHGDIGLALIECSDTKLQKYIVRTDFKSNQEEIHGMTINDVTFIEHEFLYKPTMEDIKDFCFSVINVQTDEKIVNDFIWTSFAGEEIPVWLSTENQFNFKSAYDLAVQKQGATLPVTFKMGERNGEPIYHTFETMEEADDFYLKAVSFINKTLSEGWSKKDNFNFTPYEETLNNL